MWVMEVKLRKCRYDGGEAQIVSRGGRNVIGEIGFVSECFCLQCGATVWAWSRQSEENAKEQAASYWNRGIYDGK